MPGQNVNVNNKETVIVFIRNIIVFIFNINYKKKLIPGWYHETTYVMDFVSLPFAGSGVDIYRDKEQPKGKLNQSQSIRKKLISPLPTLWICMQHGKLTLFVYNILYNIFSGENVIICFFLVFNCKSFPILYFNVLIL